MLRYLLVFVIGALFGANVAWYYARPDAGPGTREVAAPGAPSAGANPVAAGTAPAAGNPAASRPSVPATGAVPAPTIAASGLVIPVAGIGPSQLVDTYTQSRSEGRLHEAIDIMAPEGTPVLAAIDGPLAKLFTSERGGLTIYQFDPAGQRVYYYAHLQGYAPGLAEGQLLRQGQVIGYVGSTGNVAPGSPHLHFSVGDLGPERKYWKSTPVNPYPLLQR